MADFYGRFLKAMRTKDEETMKFWWRVRGANVVPMNSVQISEPSDMSICGVCSAIG
jgi:hypothetical protein